MKRQRPVWEHDVHSDSEDFDLESGSDEDVYHEPTLNPFLSDYHRYQWWACYRHVRFFRVIHGAFCCTRSIESPCRSFVSECHCDSVIYRDDDILNLNKLFIPYQIIPKLPRNGKLEWIAMYCHIYQRIISETFPLHQDLFNLIHSHFWCNFLCNFWNSEI